MEITSDIVQGNTLARQIRDVLMDRILNGELPPGSRLKDNEVAAMFGTSNTPVREALRLLAQDGLVDILPYRGCVVRAMDLDELAEGFDVRAALEQLAVRLATARLTAAQLEQLEALVTEDEAALAANDAPRRAESDQAIHRFLIDMSGNRMLVRSLRHFDMRVRAARQVCSRHLPLPSESGHRPMVDALRAGDAQRAGALMAEHVLRCKEEMIAALAPGDAPDRRSNASSN